MNGAAILFRARPWLGVSSGNAKRRGDLRKGAAHQDRWSHANHLIEGTREMRRIREVSGLRCIRDRPFGADGDHGSRQLAPQHIAAERKPRLLFE